MITGVSHIGIAVHSIEEALKFYQDQLGLTVSLVEEVPSEGVRVAMLPLGETRLELLEPLNAESPLHKFLEKRGEGVHHVALGTSNLVSELNTLSKHGIAPLGKPRRGAGGIQISFLHPKVAHGVLLEICEEPSPG